MNASHTCTFPATRIFTRDIFRLARQKHHIVALVEADITSALARLQTLKSNGHPVGLSAWLIKVIAYTVQRFPETAAYLHRKRQIRIFEQVNVSVLVEKELDGKKLPVPLLIREAGQKSVEEIATAIQAARERPLGKGNIVLHRKTSVWEKIYLLFPGVIRRLIWKLLLLRPEKAFETMGNISFTSVGMMGQVNGWFVPASVHPLAFGIGALLKKPAVQEDKIIIRDMLNMTLLLDHDVMDGAPMARFVAALLENMRKGECI